MDIGRVLEFTLFYGLGSMVMLFFMYLICMRLVDLRNELKKNTVLYHAAAVFILMSVIFDVVFNILWGSLLFLERPREWAFTDRLRRHRAASYGWRLRMADWFCEEMLNPHDPSGRHC